MATFNVRLIVNVPTVGDKVLDQTGIVAPDMMAAIQKAIANVVIHVTQVTETAP
jgi:hypothetical protein